MLEQNTITVPSFGNKRLLKSAVIYGANASGKTNVINAFSTLRNVVVERRNAVLDQLEGLEGKGRLKYLVQPFRLTSNSAREPLEYAITFIQEGVRYEFRIIINTERIISETLVAYPKGSPQVWYDRHWQRAEKKYLWRFSRHLKGDKGSLTEFTRDDVSYLSIGAKFNNKQLSNVYEWFSQKLLTMFANYYGERETGDLFDETRYAKRLAEDTNFKSKIKNLLKLADTGIIDIRAEPSEYRWDSENFVPGFNVKLVHRGKGNRMDKELRIGFELDAESSGTLKLLDLASEWTIALENDSVLVVDELDSRLHPLLTRELVELIHSPVSNPNNAQLIFNTQDTSLLDTSLFRRDQVWFTEKDQDGESHLYPLLDYSPRKDESLQKGYLQGRYGAIPIIGSTMLEAGISDETKQTRSISKA